MNEYLSLFFAFLCSRSSDLIQPCITGEPKECSVLGLIFVSSAILWVIVSVQQWAKPTLLLSNTIKCRAWAFVFDL